MILVSHDIGLVKKYADKVIEINDGKVVYDGEPSKFKIGGEGK